MLQVRALPLEPFLREAPLFILRILFSLSECLSCSAFSAPLREIIFAKMDDSQTWQRKERPCGNGGCQRRGRKGLEGRKGRKERPCGNGCSTENIEEDKTAVVNWRWSVLSALRPAARRITPGRLGEASLPE